MNMSIIEEEVPSYKTITAYSQNYFRTQDSEHSGGIILFKQQVIFEETEEGDKQEKKLLPKKFSDLTEKHFENWISYKPELILLGSGNEHLFLTLKQQSIFIKNKISIDTMNTQAACRTFNILVSDERNAMAVLFPILSNI